jgi:hypothetical protein
MFLMGSFPICSKWNKEVVTSSILKVALGRNDSILHGVVVIEARCSEEGSEK